MSVLGWVLLVLGGFAAVDLALASRSAARRLPRLARSADGAARGPLAWMFVALIRIYQAGWSGRNAGCCRFEPSCSAYALTAVRRYGGVRGGLLAARRLLRCQPFSPGGYDPVPVAAPFHALFHGSRFHGSRFHGSRPHDTRHADHGGRDHGHRQVDRQVDEREQARGPESGRDTNEHDGPWPAMASLRRRARPEIVGSRRGTRV